MNVWAPVTSKTVLQGKQEDSPMSQFLGLTLSLSSEVSALTPLQTMCQSTSPFLLNDGGGNSVAVATGNGGYTTPSSGAGVEAPDLSLVPQASRLIRERSWLDDTNIAPLDSVQCSEHNKLRTVQNMVRFVNRFGNVLWICHPDARCKVRKSAHSGTTSVPRHQCLPTGRLCSALDVPMLTQPVMLTNWGNDCAANPGAMARSCDGKDGVVNCDTLLAAPTTFNTAVSNFTGVDMTSVMKSGPMFLLPVNSPPFLSPSSVAAPSGGAPIPVTASVLLSGTAPQGSPHSNLMWLMPHDPH